MRSSSFSYLNDVSWMNDSSYKSSDQTIHSKLVSGGD